jgi:deazaflavin-dependent oxidoreductase (nitroreductase family)
MKRQPARSAAPRPSLAPEMNRSNYERSGGTKGTTLRDTGSHNLRANPVVEIRDHTVVQPMRVREVENDAERARLWDVAVATFPPYAEYQRRTTRKIPVFVAEPAR